MASAKQPDVKQTTEKMTLIPLSSHESNIHPLTALTWEDPILETLNNWPSGHTLSPSTYDGWARHKRGNQTHYRPTYQPQ